MLRKQFAVSAADSCADFDRPGTWPLSFPQRVKSRRGALCRAGKCTEGVSSGSARGVACSVQLILALEFHRFRQFALMGLFYWLQAFACLKFSPNQLEYMSACQAGIKLSTLPGIFTNFCACVRQTRTYRGESPFPHTFSKLSLTSIWKIFFPFSFSSPGGRTGASVVDHLHKTQLIPSNGLAVRHCCWVMLWNEFEVFWLSLFWHSRIPTVHQCEWKMGLTGKITNRKCILYMLRNAKLY